MSLTPPRKVSPPLEESLKVLFRQHVRAAVAMGVRLVAVAILVVILENRLPALRERSAWVTVVAAALVVWPFYTSTGRSIAWRIAIGRSYLAERRWHDAEIILGILQQRPWQPFDAQGEGIYGLATALREQGRLEEAERILHELTRTRRGIFRDRAETDLNELAKTASPKQTSAS